MTDTRRSFLEANPNNRLFRHEKAEMLKRADAMMRDRSPQALLEAPSSPAADTGPKKKPPRKAALLHRIMRVVLNLGSRSSTLGGNNAEGWRRFRSRSKALAKPVGRIYGSVQLHLRSRKRPSVSR